MFRDFLYIVCAVTILLPSIKYTNGYKHLTLKYNDLRNVLQNERFKYNRARDVDIKKSVHDDIKKQVKSIEAFLQKSDIDNAKNNYTDYDKQILEKFKETNLDLNDLKRVKHNINRAVQLGFPNKRKKIIDAMIDRVLRVADDSANSIYGNTLYEQDDIFDNTLGENDEEVKILNKFSKFFREVTKDIKLLSRNNKLRCRGLAIKNYEIGRMPEESETAGIKSSEIIEDKESHKLSLCEKYKICSDVLINFLSDFHQMLNDTVLNGLRTYGAMYSKDVATDTTYEQDVVNDVIDKVITKMDPKIVNVFENVTKSFLQTIKHDSWSKLTKDEVQHKLEVYVQDVIIKLNAATNKVIKSEFKSYKERLTKKNVIEDDLRINMKLELGNLESNMKEKICHFFNLCSIKNRSDLNDNNRRDIRAPTTNIHKRERKTIRTFSETAKAKTQTKTFNLKQMVTRTTHKYITDYEDYYVKKSGLVTIRLPSRDKSKQNRTVAIVTKN